MDGERTLTFQTKARVTPRYSGVLSILPVQINNHEGIFRRRVDQTNAASGMKRTIRAIAE